MKRLIVIAIGLSISLACSSSKDLSRGKAGKLVKEQFANGSTVQFNVFAKANLNDTGPYTQDSRITYKAGLWTNTTPQRINDLKLTDKGQRYFTSALVNNFVGNYVLTSKFSIHPEIAITGITDSGSPAQKIIEYTLTYHNDCPAEIRSACNNVEGRVEAGKLLTQLYDDGWRIVR